MANCVMYNASIIRKMWKTIDQIVLIEIGPSVYAADHVITHKQKCFLFIINKRLCRNIFLGS